MGWEVVRFHSPSPNYRELGHAIWTFLKPGLIAYGGASTRVVQWENVSEWDSSPHGTTQNLIDHSPPPAWHSRLPCAVLPACSSLRPAPASCTRLFRQALVCSHPWAVLIPFFLHPPPCHSRSSSNPSSFACPFLDDISSQWISFY